MHAHDWVDIPTTRKRQMNMRGYELTLSQQERQNIVGM